MLEQELKIFIENYSKTIFLCIGNDMRGDDGIGPLIAKNLEKLFKNKSELLVINAETVPENYTGLIRKEMPSHIIFIDAVEMNMNPGSIKLVKYDQIAEYNISTHAMPLSFMIKYLESFTDAKMLLIGIQPKNMEMSNPVSEEVKLGVEELTRIINDSFNVKHS
ncbi:MAG: hydrogenase maturation peptidase HycI [Methanobacterium sp.]|uniref:hydrogenase maturation peptidase HycI n=1 Tax=Methanobacterium sp. TaxID=2164 RepID=UPI003C7823D2